MTATVEKKITPVTQPVKAKDVSKAELKVAPIVTVEPVQVAVPVVKEIEKTAAILGASPATVDSILKTSAEKEIVPFVAPGTDEVPTERQIKNAERVLRAAGRDTDTMVASAVARVMKSGKGGGVLSVDGVTQTPLYADISAERGAIRFGTDEPTIYIPYRIAAEIKNKFNIYKVSHEGNDITYAVDSESCVELSSNSSNARPFSRRPGCSGVLVLINSYSKNDVVLGENTLLGVDSIQNLLNNTSLSWITRADKEDTRLYLPWGSEDGTDRPSVTSCYFKQSNFQNTHVTNGTYVQTTAHDSTIDSPGHTVLNNCDLYSSSLRGTRISMKGVMLERAGVVAEGSVIGSKARLSNCYISAPSIHVTNKLCYLSIDTPSEKLDLIRISEEEFAVTGHWGGSTKIKLDATREEITEFVGDLNRTPRKSAVTPDIISQSVVDYITDSIESRFKIVRLIDSASLLTGVSTYGDHYFSGDLYSV